MEELVGDYKIRDELAKRSTEALDSFPQRDRAQVEGEIWALVPASDRKVGGKAKGKSHWLAAALGASSAEYEHRANLLSWGPVVDVFWERLETDMTLSTAIDLLRTAKKLPGEIGEAVQKAVRDYDALPNATKLPDGKVIRKHGLASLPDRRERVDRRATEREREREREREGTRTRVNGSAETETVWNQIRGALGSYIAARLVGLDPRVAEEIYRDFERDLNLVVDDYQRKIDRTRSAGEKGNRITRRMVVSACSDLALDPPRPGVSVDLGAARRQQRKLAKLYHPDSNLGDETTRALYERVIQAYQRLDAYNEGLAGREDAGTVVVSADVEVKKDEEADHGGSGDARAQ